MVNVIYRYLKFLVSILIFCLTESLFANIEILEDNSNHVKLRLRAPFPQIENISESSTQHSSVSVPGWSYISNENKFRLPFYSTTLHLESDKISFSVKSQKSSSVKIHLLQKPWIFLLDPIRLRIIQNQPTCYLYQIPSSQHIILDNIVVIICGPSRSSLINMMKHPVS